MLYFVVASALLALVAADVSHLTAVNVEADAAATSAGYAYGSEVRPGYDASSHQPKHLIPAQQEIIPGGDSSSYQPEHLIPAHLRTAEVIPGSDASSYQPEHLIPAHLRTAEVIPGSDASSYQPEHLIPAHLRTAEVIPGSDASSYQPEHLIPAHLRTAEVIPGGDSSSYQPEHLIPAHLRSTVASQATVAVEAEAVPPSIGADSYTPEQFIPIDVRIAHEKYIQEAQATGEAATAEVRPGSGRPADLIPAYLHSRGGSLVSGSASSNYQQYDQFVPQAIGADTITPAHLYQEPQSNGIEQFDAETHVPVVIGRDTVQPAYLRAGSSLGSSSSAYSAGIDTKYAPNGGYVY